jgi:phospholipase C
VANTKTDRRQFMQLMGAGAVASSLNASIAKALAIPANVRTGSIKDVEHIVILMQENNSFDEYFGTLRGVRGFSDPRAVTLLSGNPVWLQPAGVYAADGAPAAAFGGVNSDLVIPPFRLNPAFATSANAPTDTSGAVLTSLGLVYRADLDHGWTLTHEAWNLGQWDQWPTAKTPLTMSYQTREDIPWHYAIADAFTVGDAYHCSVFSSTNPNRYYMWTGSIGNVAGCILPNGTPTAQGTNGHGAGPATSNGYIDGYPLAWTTYPEVLQQAGISWKIYQDLAGSTFAGDFGGGGPSSFAGTYQDNMVLYFNQYSSAPVSSPLFQNGIVTGSTNITGSSTQVPPSATMPAADAAEAAWQAWAGHLFDVFRNDVQNGTLPQVSWIVPPAGYSEHPAWPTNYGAWYISQVLEILTSNPEVFSKTVFLINYDENDGFFDHIVSPTPPQSTDGSDGASTVGNAYEIVTTSTPNGPIGLGVRVPFLVISPWSKGGFVSSEVFDHSSTVRFIEKRFDLPPFSNITPWRRAVCGDLTSCFNFRDPNGSPVPNLPDTTSYLPTPAELNGGGGAAIVQSSLAQVIPGLPTQEKGIRRARALPYELDVLAAVAGSTVTLQFINEGRAAAVFQVRSTNSSDQVRNYTVEAGKSLSGSWTVSGSTYNLSVYGPNGFVRYLQGSVGATAAALTVQAVYGKQGAGSIDLRITNATANQATLSVLDAYTGATVPAHFSKLGDAFAQDWSLEAVHGWYDLVITVAEDTSFSYRVAGHVETGRDSFSDPAMGGLVALKA